MIIDKRQRIIEIIAITIMACPNGGNVSYNEAKVLAKRAAQMILELDILEPDSIE